MNPTSGSFASRLRQVIGSRKIDPWAKRLRIAAGTRANMLKGDGVPPHHETLAKIMRVENCSISWLLGANTAPYLVARTIDDAETANLLRQHLIDEPDWRIHLLKSCGLHAWVLHQAAYLYQDGDEIQYTAISVIAGPSGEAVRKLLINWSEGRISGTTDVDTETMRHVYGGQLGTFHLFGDGDHSGLLRAEVGDAPSVADLLPEHAPPAPEVMHVYPATRIAEPDNALSVSPRIARELASLWPVFQENEREAVSTLLDPFLERVAKRHKTNAN